MNPRKRRQNEEKSTFLSILLIQLAVIVYTGSGNLLKDDVDHFKAFSFMWIFWVGMEVVCLAFMQSSGRDHQAL